MPKNYYLKELIVLIDSLSNSEIEVAKKHLLAYHSNHTKHTKKMFRLFQLIATKNITDYEDLKNKVSIESNYSSFNRLISRLKVRIQESLILDVNILRNGEYSEIFKKRYQLGKELIQARILYSKGLVQLSSGLYDKIIKKAVKFELFDETIEALMFKLNFNSNKKRSIQYTEISNRIKYYKKERESLDEIRSLVHEYSAELGVRSGKLSMIDSLENYLKEIYRKQKETSSCNSLSVLLLMQIEYCMIKNETKYLIFLGGKLLNILMNNPSVYSVNRIIYINNELARSYLLEFNFNSVWFHTNSAIKLFKKNYNRNYLNSMYIQISVFIFERKFQLGISAINDKRLKPILEKYLIDKSKFSFLESICCFGICSFKESFHLLNDIKEIEKDKEGWNIWIRIMRILCSIELLRLNLVDYDIESFRKYIQRMMKEGNVNPRVELILKILVELDRTNFNFVGVAQKRKLELQNLKKTTGKYKWDIKSPEMILFHDWFNAKLENREYKPNLEPYKKQVEKDEAKPLSKTKEKKYRALGLIE